MAKGLAIRDVPLLAASKRYKIEVFGIPSAENPPGFDRFTKV